MKFGKIIDKRSGNRIDLNVVTECIFTDHSSVFFDMQVEEVAWKEITKFLDELEKVSKKGKREENLKLLNLIILTVSINWGEKVSTLSGFV